MQNVHIGLTAAVAALAVFLGHALQQVSAERMPQVAGEDVLALVLGDARQVLSNAMLEKADEYFHGGVHGVVCEHGMTGGDTGHVHAECSADDHEAAAERGHVTGTLDPWVWLDSNVHAQEHRHADGEKSRELLPWLWAACRASPENIEAYETSAYVLAHMTKRPDEAVKLLESGIRKNPSNASLEFSLGEIRLHVLHENAAAERAFAAAREKCWPAEGKKGAEDRFLKCQALFYLGYLARQRGDLAQAQAYLAEAEKLDPDNVSTRDLRKVLQAK